VLFNEYWQRFHRMAWALERHMPQGVKFDKPAGGLNFWVKLPPQLNSQMLYKSAIERQLVFAPGELFYVRKPDENCIRLSIAAVKFGQIEAGIKLLSQLIRLRQKLDQMESPLNVQYQDPIL